jgi:hypothetical protein
MTEALLSACIQLSGKYTCSAESGGGPKSVVKVYSSVVDGAHNYRFGVIGKWDFIADGVSHPMKDWPVGSAYRATCTENGLDIEQLRSKPGKSAVCGGFADRIIYVSQLIAMDSSATDAKKNLSAVVENFAFKKSEAHHCADGRKIGVLPVPVVCSK